MRRAIARGRLVPQSLSTDPRMGRVSLKAALLFPLMWINCDDQGRISGDPDEVKYATCPNIDGISKADIPELLKELESQELIRVYATSKTKAIQMLDWWDEQKLQWAYPSRYPSPPGWQDRLRYHPTPTEIITENWPASKTPKDDLPPDSKILPSKLPSALPSKETHEELGEEIRVELMSLPDFKSYLVEHEMVREALVNLGAKKGCLPKQEVTTELGRVDLCWEGTGGQFVAAFEIDAYSPKKKSLAKLKALACPYSFVILRSNPEPFQWEQDIALIGLGRARGKKSKSWQGPLPSPEIKTEKEEGKGRGRGKGTLPSTLGSTSPPSSSPAAFNLINCFEQAWGRSPTSRESAQLRDLEKEISSAGGATAEQIHDAFKEAAVQSKLHISYVRAILLDWLGVERIRAP